MRPPSAAEAAKFLGIPADSYNGEGKEELQVSLGAGYLATMIKAKMEI